MAAARITHSETHEPELPAGPFSAWLRSAREARISREGANVPCGECRACCTSAYFIPIAPDESDTLSHIPKALLFPAPGRPKDPKGSNGPKASRSPNGSTGTMLLGYRENGHCPLFLENRCTIYAHRPRTCRQYDCRVFPATGTAVDEGKPLVAAQTGRWRFAFPTAQDRGHFAAVQAAARFLDLHAEAFPPGFLPAQPAQRAMAALEVFEMFLGPGEAARQSGDEASIRARIDAVVAALGSAGKS